MSDLGAAVERMLTGGTGTPTFHEQLSALVAQEGSGRAAARRLGVAESTVRRWRHGGKPKQANLSAFEQVTRQLRAKAFTNADIKLHTREESDRANLGRPREREISARQLGMDAGAAARIRDAYVSGGAEAAAAAFRDEVKVPFYRAYLRDPDADNIHGATVASEYGAAILA